MTSLETKNTNTAASDRASGIAGLLHQEPLCGKLASNKSRQVCAGGVKNRERERERERARERERERERETGALHSQSAAIQVV